MGVYINTEMPKEGMVFVIDSAGQVWSKEWPIRGYIRLDGVTAVPVPPHGKLIDADELKVLVYANIALFDSAPGRMGAEQKLVRAWLASMVDDIDDAPTIIPAEEVG